MMGWKNWLDVPDSVIHVPHRKSYENRLSQIESRSSQIDVTVVCNEYEMTGDEMVQEKEEVEEVYKSQKELEFDVTVKENLSTSELSSVLKSDIDFLHYIGHIEDQGFKCEDGFLDVSELDKVGVEAFLLNGCTSYHKGKEFIDKGSISGVTTLSDIPNSGAVRVGFSFARLLNHGFPMKIALEIARHRSLSGPSYVLIGDPDVSISQADSGTPKLYHLHSPGYDIETRQKTMQLEIEMFPTRESNLGSTFFPYLEDVDERFLNSGIAGPFTVSVDELQEFIGMGHFPVISTLGYGWSHEINVEEVYKISLRSCIG